MYVSSFGVFNAYYFFFFKRKTAYELHISDWNSDVCSSDLLGGAHAVARDVDDVIDAAGDPVIAIRVAPAAVAREIIARIGREIGLEEALVIAPHRAHLPRPAFGDAQIALGRVAGLERSEEHTSELQSLMRISYAVFCLKKKINMTTEPH